MGKQIFFLALVLLISFCSNAQFSSAKVFSSGPLVDSSFIWHIDSLVAQIEKKSLEQRVYDFSTSGLQNIIKVLHDSTKKVAYKAEQLQNNERGDVKQVFYYDGVEPLKATLYFKDVKDKYTKSFVIYFKEMEIVAYKCLKDGKVIVPDEEEQDLIEDMLLGGLTFLTDYQKSR